jgi:hypothetical protein
MQMQGLERKRCTVVEVDEPFEVDCVWWGADQGSVLQLVGEQGAAAGCERQQSFLYHTLCIISVLVLCKDVLYRSQAASPGWEHII